MGHPIILLRETLRNSNIFDKQTYSYKQSSKTQRTTKITVYKMQTNAC